MQKRTSVGAMIGDGQPLILAGLNDVLNEMPGVSAVGIA